MPDLTGPNFGYWMLWGTVALCVIGLYFAVLYWVDNYLNARRNEEARRRDEARLEQQRRLRALRIVNELKPLSDRIARRH